jgi:hypothetical protein
MRGCIDIIVGSMSSEGKSIYGRGWVYNERDFVRNENTSQH